jgi:hypothetical protein
MYSAYYLMIHDYVTDFCPYYAIVFWLLARTPTGNKVYWKWSLL